MIRLLRDTLRLPPSVLLGSLIINLLGLALPLVVLQIFDRVLRYQALDTLGLLILGLICVVLVEMIMRFTRSKLVAQTALHESFDLHMKGVSRFLNAPRRETARFSSERSADGMAAIDEMGQFLSGNARLALLDFPFVLVFLGLIWAIAGMLVIVPAVLVVVFSVWTIWSSVNFKRLLNEQIRLERERFDFYSECLRGIATVKSLAIEPQMQRRLERILQSGASVSNRLVLRSNRMIANGQLFASLTIVSIVSVGGFMAIEGMITIGAVAACLLIGNRVTQPVLRIIGVWGQMEAARLARERYEPLLAFSQSEERSSQSTSPVSVQLSDVAMTDEHGSVEDTGFSVSIEPREVVGFVIPRFAQRAQFIELMRGTTPPERGTLKINGLDSFDPDGENHHRHVFFVGSKPEIFHGTILDNISMFHRVSHGAAIEAARRLGVEPVIHALPQGYHTRLGDIGAAQLPLDIQQAICIARAAAHQPSLLLLDVRRVPPDDVSTRACTQAIAELRSSTTIVIVGRHMSEVVDADRIFMLQDGRLTQMQTNADGKADETGKRETLADTDRARNEA